MASGPTTPQRGGCSVGLLAAWLCTVAALCTVALRVDVTDPTATARGLALCFIPYGALLVVRVEASDRALWLSLLGGATAGLCMVAAPSLLSDDVYRYLWDGRMWLSGRDAYALPPDAPSLAAMRNADYARINHSHIATIYPPLSQALFALTTALWAHVAAFKLLALGLHLLTTLLVARLARATGNSGGRAALLWSLNPLCLSEAALGGHVDTAVGLCVVALALTLASGRTWQAVGITAAISGLKLLGLFLAPLLWRSRGGRVATAAAVALSLLCVVPPLGAGDGDDANASGLSHYAQRWRGNEGPFRWIEATVAPLAELMASSDSDPIGTDELQLRWLAGPLAALGSGPSVFAHERKAPRPPATFARAHVTFMLARGLGLGLVFAVAVIAVRRRWEPHAALRAVLWTLLMTSPQLHPWYLLWLLPLDIAVGKRSGIVWSATALIAYAPLTDWHLHRLWHAAPSAVWLQYVPVAICLLIEIFWPAKHTPTCVLPLTATTGTD